MFFYFSVFTISNPIGSSKVPSFLHRWNTQSYTVEGKVAARYGQLEAFFVDPWPYGTDPDSYLWRTDPDSDPDPGIFVSDLQDDNWNFFSKVFHFEATFTSFFKDKKP